jgi:hypothetical protein
MDRQAKLFRMTELHERLHDCYDQWHTASGATEQYLARSIQRDMGEFRQLCQAVRCDSLLQA